MKTTDISSALALLCAFLSLVLSAAPPAAAQVVVPLHPRGTFLRANQDSVVAPSIQTLGSLGIAPGDLIRIRVLGHYQYTTNPINISRSSVAVFSASATLLASSLQQRVPDAIDAGIDFVSAPTFRGGLPTDIPQDFRLGDTPGEMDHADVVVPPGATHLFIGTHDSLYEDNSDPDSDFAAEVTVLCAAGTCCDADFNRDGSVNSQDFFDFLGAFFAGAPSADFNSDGAVNSQDFFDFLTAFFTGC